MTSYIFPFEYVSLVLLAAMLGAAILTRESKTRDAHPADDAPAAAGDGDANPEETP
jgi:hypothetical protein